MTKCRGKRGFTPLERKALLTGFTLVEMLVVLTTLGLLVGGSVATYFRFNEKNLVRETGKELVVALRAAQKKTSAGEKPTAGCATLDGYVFRIVGGAASYRVGAICDGNDPNNDGNLVDSQTYQLRYAEQGVTISTQVRILFRVLTGQIQFLEGSSGNYLNIDITKTATPWVYQIRVTDRGAISYICFMSGGHCFTY